jgi:hypothetical protein
MKISKSKLKEIIREVIQEELTKNESIDTKKTKKLESISLKAMLSSDTWKNMTK